MTSTKEAHNLSGKSLRKLEPRKIKIHYDSRGICRNLEGIFTCVRLYASRLQFRVDDLEYDGKGTRSSVHKYLSTIFLIRLTYIDPQI